MSTVQSLAKDKLGGRSGTVAEGAISAITNRGESIKSLSNMLRRVYLAQADDEIARRRSVGQPERESIYESAFAELLRA